MGTLRARRFFQDCVAVGPRLLAYGFDSEVAKTSVFWVEPDGEKVLFSVEGQHSFRCAPDGRHFMKAPSDRSAPVVMLDASGRPVAELGAFEAGIYFQTLFMRHALRVGDTVKIAYAMSQEAIATIAPGAKHRDKATDLSTQVELLARKSKDPQAIAIALATKGTVKLYLGEWQAAIAAGADSERILQTRCRGVHWALASTRWMTCIALQSKGELAELAERFDRHVAGAARVGDRYALALFKTSFHRVWLARDDVARAREDLSGALATWRRATITCSTSSSPSLAVNDTCTREMASAHGTP